MKKTNAFLLVFLILAWPMVVTIHFYAQLFPPPVYRTASGKWLVASDAYYTLGEETSVLVLDLGYGMGYNLITDDQDLIFWFYPTCTYYYLPVRFTTHLNNLTLSLYYQDFLLETVVWSLDNTTVHENWT
jgi:hypothetical protein